MITSKELLAKTGISRATLNNYIAQGLLPRPQVAAPSGSDDSAPRIGYFDDAALERVEEIKRLKQSGLKMAEIIDRLGATRPVSSDSAYNEGDMFSAPKHPQGPAPTPVPTPSGAQAARDVPLHVTVEELAYPAYMVNNRFEVQWWNRAAANQIFQDDARLGDEIDSRNIFELLLRDVNAQDVETWRDAVAFHMEVAKRRHFNLSTPSSARGLSEPAFQMLSELAGNTQPAESFHILHKDLSYLAFGRVTRDCTLYVTFFREGILFAYVPRSLGNQEIMGLLSARAPLIRDLLNNRRPFLTDISIVSVQLENEERLAAEMSPTDYFSFMNDLWARNETLLRRHHGSSGKHPGNGLLAHFFPEPDSSYLMNALAYAAELKELARDLERHWRQKIPSLPPIHLNSGVDLGRDWFGAFRSPAQIEFRALGPTSARAVALSELATSGMVLANKAAISGLDLDEVARVQYGVRRHDTTGSSFFVPNLFSQVESLAGTAMPSPSLSGIAVAEVADVTGN